jgi:hypothetical protein
MPIRSAAGPESTYSGKAVAFVLCIELARASSSAAFAARTSAPVAPWMPKAVARIRQRPRRLTIHSSSIVWPDPKRIIG